MLKKSAHAILTLVFTSILTAVAVLVFSPIAMLDALAVKTIWGWYVTPMWGVAEPTMLAAFGLSSICHLLAHRGHDSRSDEERKKALWRELGSAAIRGPIAIGLCWLALQVFG
jgi:hypothetical protein